MPEHEGMMGIIHLLQRARDLMEPGEARTCVEQAIDEAVKVTKLGLSNLDIGMSLGRIFKELEDFPP